MLRHYYNGMYRFSVKIVWDSTKKQSRKDRRRWIKVNNTARPWISFLKTWTFCTALGSAGKAVQQMLTLMKRSCLTVGIIFFISLKNKMSTRLNLKLDKWFTLLLYCKISALWIMFAYNKSALELLHSWFGQLTRSTYKSKLFEQDYGCVSHSAGDASFLYNSMLMMLPQVILQNLQLWNQMCWRTNLPPLKFTSHLRLTYEVVFPNMPNDLCLLLAVS